MQWCLFRCAYSLLAMNTIRTPYLLFLTLVPVYIHEYIYVRVGHDLGEPLSRCGRHSSASECVHFLGGISPISLKIPKSEIFVADLADRSIF